MNDLVQHGESKTLNLVSPRQPDWASLLPIVVEHWGLNIVPFDIWVAAPKAADAKGTASLDTMPSLKGVNFLKNIADELMKTSENRTLNFAMENVQRASQAMAQWRSIDKMALNIWLDQWRFRLYCP